MEKSLAKGAEGINRADVLQTNDNAQKLGFMKRHPKVRKILAWIMGGVAGSSAISSISCGGEGGSDDSNDDAHLDNPHHSGDLGEIVISRADGGSQPDELDGLYALSDISFDEPIQNLLDGVDGNGVGGVNIPMFISEDGSINTLIKFDKENSDISAVTMIVKLKDGAEKELDLELSDIDGGIDVGYEIGRVDGENLLADNFVSVVIVFETSDGEKLGEFKLDKSTIAEREDDTVCLMDTSASDVACGNVNPRARDQEVILDLPNGAQLVLNVQQKDTDNDGVGDAGDLYPGTESGEPVNEDGGSLEQVDNDGDGFSEQDGDSDDSDPNTYPGANDIPGDGIDQDGDGHDDRLLPVDDSQFVDEDGSLMASVYATDEEGEPLTFPVDYSVQQGPKNGTVEMDADGTYTYIPNADFHGPDSFVYAAEVNGQSFEGNVSINVLSTPDSVEAGVLSVTMNEDNVYTGKFPVENKDGVDLTFNISKKPFNGSVTLNADGTFTYTPNENYFGKDRFEYEVKKSNGDGETVTGSVQIEVEGTPDLPTASDFTIDEIPFGGEAKFNPLEMANAVDPDGGGLIVYNDIVVGGSIKEETDGSYTFTHDGFFEGDATCTFKIIDEEGNELTVQGTMKINAPDKVPDSLDFGTTRDVVPGSTVYSQIKMVEGIDGSVEPSFDAGMKIKINGGDWLTMEEVEAMGIKVEEGNTIQFSAVAPPWEDSYLPCQMFVGDGEASWDVYTTASVETPDQDPPSDPPNNPCG